MLLNIGPATRLCAESSRRIASVPQSGTLKKEAKLLSRSAGALRDEIKTTLNTSEDAVRVIMRYVSWEYFAERQKAHYRPEV
jgi:hypothetical protein